MLALKKKETENFYRALRLAGLKQSSCLIWVKNQLVLGRGDYHSKHEPIWYGWKPGATHTWNGGRKQTTIDEAGDLVPIEQTGKDEYLINADDLHIVVTGKNVMLSAVEADVIYCDKPQKSPLHPTIKPVALIERLIKNGTDRGGVVLDAFGGSGSTLIACEETRRCARLIELEPKYCDVIVRRWQKLSGKKASHAVTGAAFGE